MNTTFTGTQDYCLKNCDNSSWIWSDNNMGLSCRSFCSCGKKYSLSHRVCNKKMILFLFCLAGEINLIVADNHQKNKLSVTANTYSICCVPRSKQYFFKYPPAKNVQIFWILFPYNAFTCISGKSEMSAKLQNLIKTQKAFSQVKTVTPKMLFNISQILNSSQHRSDQNFFFIARIMDLINCMQCNLPEKIRTHITSLEQQQAEKAEDILKNNIENPPSLNNLAECVGVSLAKFKLLFPKIYGMPPYCYLRKLRMEKAMELLSNREMNVTQSAYEVGYNSLSHFSTVFTKHFGIKPSKVHSLSMINNLPDK